MTSQNDQLLKTKTTIDELGRVILSEQTEDGTNYSISARNVYEQMGKITYSSNPARVAGASTDGWTRATSDTAGRVTEVATFSGAAQPSATGYTNGTGQVSTAYDANFTTVTDQAGKVRRSMVDALGRLVRLDEPITGNNLGSTASPTQSTSYTYSVLGNLLTVTQGVQTRTFTYDSLSRLRTAVNPESGTLSYQYDDNGNLLVKTDARGVSAHYAYDALNRAGRRWYNGSSSLTSTTNNSPTLPTGVGASDEVKYFYDTQTLPGGAPTFDRGYATGRLVGVTYGGGSAGTYRGYDARGAVLRQYQQTDAVNYLAEASYRLNGSMQNQTYPSVPGAGDRRTVSYTNDNAGRLASLSSAATSYAPAASVSGIGYSAPGGLSSETYGNNLVHAVTYNSRLQTNEIKLGTSGAPASNVSITYNYGTTANNGNLQSTSYAGGGLSYTQTFGYDELNRLTTSQEGASWSQTNSYDKYGNRSIVGGALSFTASNNRITGWSYDAAGNLLNDGAHGYTFDAENKISKVDGVSAYVYDGDGQRVRKLVNENLRFIYGIGGQQMAEFDGATGALKKEYVYGASGLLATIKPTAVNANGTRYTTSDHLGSPRLVTSSVAGVVSRHDYMPFGEELFNGGRTFGMGYGTTDGIRQKFTSKERDNETGLDYFGARYHSSGQGRFTSPDPLLSSGKSLQPQSWNRYSYCLNDPLKYVDPKGLIWGKKKTSNTNTEYTWFEGDTVGEGYDTVTEFYVEGMVGGQRVGLTLNKSGPRSFWMQLALDFNPALMGDNSDYFVKGYQVGPTKSQQAEFSRFGSVGMMPNQAFDVGLVFAGGGLGRLNRAGAVSATEGTTTLYRAVSDAEFEQILRTGTFEAGANSVAGKHFAETAEQAAQWGLKLQKLEGKGAFRIVDAQIPTVQAERFIRWESLDGVGPARYAELPQLRNAVIGKVP